MVQLAGAYLVHPLEGVDRTSALLLALISHLTRSHKEKGSLRSNHVAVHVNVLRFMEYVQFVEP